MVIHWNVQYAALQTLLVNLHNLCRFCLFGINIINLFVNKKFNLIYILVVSSFEIILDTVFFLFYIKLSDQLFNVGYPSMYTQVTGQSIGQFLPSPHLHRNRHKSCLSLSWSARTDTTLWFWLLLRFLYILNKSYSNAA